MLKSNDWYTRALRRSRAGLPEEALSSAEAPEISGQSDLGENVLGLCHRAPAPLS